MPFYSAPLHPSATPAGTPFGAVNLFSNHVAKTSSVIDVVFKSEVGMDTSATPLSFVKVTSEADTAKEEEANCGAAASHVTDAEADTALMASASSLLSPVAGLVTPVGKALVFTPLASLASFTGRVILTNDLPSGKDIASVTRLAPTTTSVAAAPTIGTKTARDECHVATEDAYILVDTVGNVYLVLKAFAALQCSAAAEKKARTEEVFSSSASVLSTPILIASAAAQEPMCGALPSYGMGCGGWIGVDVVAFDEITGEVVVAVGRENHRDVRVIRFFLSQLVADAVSITSSAVAAAEVIASFYSHHAPTSMAVIRNDQAKEWTTLIAVANGPLITFYDASLKSSVGGVKRSGRVVNGNLSNTICKSVLASTTRSPFHIITTRSTVWSLVSVNSVTAKKGTATITNTSTNAEAAPYFLWAASSDRSLTLIDCSRNFMRVHSSPNILKYDAVTAALATASSDVGTLPVQVAVSGVDCEVRAIANITLALPGTTKDAKEKNNGKKDAEKKVDAGAESENASPAGAPDTHNPNSFRGRLNSAIHGDDVWVGRWCSFTVEGHTGTIAVGLTRTGSVYVVA